MGITSQEIEKLITLDKKDFEYREWLALTYVRDWMLLNGREPDESYMNDYRSSFSKKERGYILKLSRMMRFSNFWNNRFRARPWRADMESCPIGGESRPGTDG